MPNPRDDESFQVRLERLSRLLEQIDRFPEGEHRTIVCEAITTINEMQGAALNSILEHVTELGAGGRPLLDRLARDELISGLLVLHGLHPLDLASRVQQALDSVRPQLASHGGSVQLLDISPAGAVRLRLEGSCGGCPSSRATLQHTIEQAVCALAPDAAIVEVEGLDALPAAAPRGVFVPLSQLSASATNNGHCDR